MDMNLHDISSIIIRPLVQRNLLCRIRKGQVNNQGILPIDGAHLSDRFVVDGISTVDPRNPVIKIGTGTTQSLLDIPVDPIFTNLHSCFFNESIRKHFDE